VCGLTGDYMMTGWLVNDCLTCIPGTRTFWHDMLERIPGLVDKTGGYTNFAELANKIERTAVVEGQPDYIIRNATFFRRMNIQCKQISLLQDCYVGDTQQVDVGNTSTVTVFNSNYTYQHYKDLITKCKVEIIPIGVDFQLFNKSNDKHPNVLPNSILFVGASTNHPKGFNVILDLINNTDFNFCLVMKDNFSISNPRVSVFNSVNHDTLVRIYNSCEMLICTSVVETQHLASIEGGACGLPIITTNVGALYNTPSGEWGLKESNNNYKECIDYIKNHKDEFSPRNYFIKLGLDKKNCINRWIKLIYENI
jgi:glycosyltransferase involved in cell wall biosynthesis